MPFLGLQNIKILSHDEAGDHLHFVVESTTTPLCPHCQSKHLHKWTPKKNQHFIDIPTHGKPTAIWLDRKRWKCVSCGKTFLEYLEWIDDTRKMTKRLVEYIKTESLKKTFASLSKMIGVDPKTIKNVFEEYVAALQNNFHFETPEILGINEIHLMKKPRGICTNIGERTILDILKDRNKTTFISYLKTLDTKKVQLIIMDMWQPYRDAATEVIPHAQIIVDKFHVVRLANDALEKVRKDNRGILKLSQNRDLMRDRLILLRRNKELSDQEHFALSHLLNNYGDLAKAYALKEAFYDIYDASDGKEAYSRYEVWVSGLTADIKPYFDDLHRAVKSWHKEIFSYFAYRHTNAYIESVNNIARHFDRDERGHSFEILRAKLIYTHGKIKRKTTKSENGDSGDIFTMSKAGSYNSGMGSVFTREKTLFYGADIFALENLVEHGQ